MSVVRFRPWAPPFLLCFEGNFSAFAKINYTAFIRKILSFDNFSTTFSHVFIVSFGTAQTKHTSPFWIWLTIDWLTSTEDELTRCILINKKKPHHMNSILLIKVVHMIA